MLGGPDPPEPAFGAPDAGSDAAGVSGVATVCGRADRALARFARDDGLDRAGFDGVSTLTAGSSDDWMAPVASTGAGSVAVAGWATAVC
jgi:hypothetical protein